ncbi:hypothetical protein MTR_1g051860 [Medicago truncatula]|nr:hypothetical protein MTR_1g051860 [Medicago truncatula]
MKHNRHKLIRFEECWLRESNLKEEIARAWEDSGTNLSNRIKRCVEDLARREADRYGDVPKSIKITQMKLDKLNRSADNEGVASEIRRQK